MGSVLATAAEEAQPVWRDIRPYELPDVEDTTGAELYDYVRLFTDEIQLLPGYPITIYDRLGHELAGTGADISELVIPERDVLLSEMGYGGMSWLDRVQYAGLSVRFMPPTLKQQRRRLISVYVAPFGATREGSKFFVVLDNMPTGQQIFDAIDEWGFPERVSEFAVLKLNDHGGPGSVEIAVSRDSVLSEPIFLGGNRVLIVNTGPSYKKKRLLTDKLVRRTENLPHELVEKIAEYLEGGKRRTKRRV